MKKILISPSVLAANFAKLGEECLSVEKAGADMIHLDVMDGIFVPNISFGLPVVNDLKKVVSVPLDVHLMISRPDLYVEKFIKAGADIITFHVEAYREKTAEILQFVKSFGVKAGLSLKPDTHVSSLLPYKELFDLILVMSVEPGFGGQCFIPFSLDKIREVRRLFPDVLIEVDGGINVENAKEVIVAGADILVAGSAVFKATDRKKAVSELRE